MCSEPFFFNRLRSDVVENNADNSSVSQQKQLQFEKKRCKLLKHSVELGVRLSHDFAPFHTESVVMRSFVKLKPSNYSDFQKIESVNQNIC